MSDGSAGPGANMQRFTPVCAIGASAGGVSALRSFFRQIPDDLGLASTPSSPHLAAIALLSRDADGPTCVERVRRTEFIAHLAPHTSYLGELDRPLHRLADAVPSGGGLILRYADSQGLEALVDAVLGEQR